MEETKLSFRVHKHSEKKWVSDAFQKFVNLHMTSEDILFTLIHTSTIETQSLRVLPSFVRTILSVCSLHIYHCNL